MPAKTDAELMVEAQQAREECSELKVLREDARDTLRLVDEVRKTGTVEAECLNEVEALMREIEANVTGKLGYA